MPNGETEQSYGFKEVHDAIERLNETALAIMVLLTAHSMNNSEVDWKKIIQIINDKYLSEQMKNKGITLD